MFDRTPGFGESVSGVRWQEILSNKSKNNKIHDTHFFFPTTKGSMNACMELVGFSTSNKVKNDRYSFLRAAPMCVYIYIYGISVNICVYISIYMYINSCIYI